MAASSVIALAALIMGYGMGLVCTSDMRGAVFALGTGFIACGLAIFSANSLLGDR